MTIIQGLGGPNPTPKGLGDGQPVNIPAHLLDKIKKTKSSTLSGLLDFHLQHKIFQVL